MWCSSVDIEYIATGFEVPCPTQIFHLHSVFRRKLNHRLEDVPQFLDREKQSTRCMIKTMKFLRGCPSLGFEGRQLAMFHKVSLEEE